MKELKKLIIDNLLSDYTPEEAKDQVDKAEITIKGDQVRVIYDNGKSDLFRLITVEKLEHVKNS